jgi:uncharacterized membrane protein HdeD (DUF308 family)
MYEESRSSAQLREMTGGWWIASLVGLMSIAAGVIVVAKPSDSLATLAVVSGIFILVDGIVAVVGALAGDTESHGLVAILGVISVVIGVLLIRHPISGVNAVALLLGLWLIASAVVRVVVAFEVRDQLLRRLVVAAILAIVGILIVSSPHIRYTTLALIVGIGFIVYGVSMLVLGWALRTVHHAAAPRAPQGAATA